MNHSAKIFIAGHRGLVGSAIVRNLQKAGYDHIITRTRAELDLTDQHAVSSFFAAEKPEYVFLAAAKVGGIHANNTYPADFIYQNLTIQNNIIHHSYVQGVKKLLFLGSSCIYPKLCPQPMKEEHLLTGPLEPTNSAYAVAKIAGIEMCRSYNRQHGTKFIPVMPTNLYGTNDNFDLENSHVLPAMIRKFHLARLAVAADFAAIGRDEKLFGTIPADIKSALSQPVPQVILWGSGTPKREFLHVDDMADACIYLMQHYNHTDLVNIGTGQDLTIKELAELVARIVGFTGEIVFDSSKPDGTPRKLLDVSRLRQTGWSPSISLEQGIRDVYQWYISRSA
ncbi:MAG: GDP-L-fucose synthase [Desulfobacteraceae bacterium]|nr:MAG: GDP-L-fucose synthase [Desulfobacteraceae bacterium]